MPDLGIRLAVTCSPNVAANVRSRGSEVVGRGSDLGSHGPDVLCPPHSTFLTDSVLQVLGESSLSLGKITERSPRQSFAGGIELWG